MRILHISDLHFGTESGNIAEHLLKSIHTLAPQIIVISGDFTQIASHAEFKKAQSFIRNCRAPVFCIPGNHDIPRYSLKERFFRPYNRYKTYIYTDLSPCMIKNEFVMTGINTARRILPHWNWAHGAISKKQLQKIDKDLSGIMNKYRICVMHHPIHKAEQAPLKVIVFGAKYAMQKIHDLKIDLVLTGHVHFASITVVGKTVFASASTAISPRLRTQQNGFNVIDLNTEYFDITHFVYNGVNFKPNSTHRHNKNR